MGICDKPLTVRATRHLGFTLVELMVTVSLVAILLGIGVPTFREFIQSQRVRTVSSDLNVALTFARAEAIKRNRQIAITPAAAGWQDGWAITVVSDGTTLNEQMAYPGVTMTGPASLTYGRDGRLATMAPDPFEITGDESVRCVSLGLNGIPINKKASC